MSSTDNNGNSLRPSQQLGAGTKMPINQQHKQPPSIGGGSPKYRMMSEISSRVPSQLTGGQESTPGNRMSHKRSLSKMGTHQQVVEATDESSRDRIQFDSTQVQDAMRRTHMGKTGYPSLEEAAAAEPEIKLHELQNMEEPTDQNPPSDKLILNLETEYPKQLSKSNTKKLKNKNKNDRSTDKTQSNDTRFPSIVSNIDESSFQVRSKQVKTIHLNPKVQKPGAFNNEKNYDIAEILEEDLKAAAVKRAGKPSPRRRGLGERRTVPGNPANPAGRVQMEIGKHDIQITGPIVAPRMKVVGTVKSISAVISPLSQTSLNQNPWNARSSGRSSPGSPASPTGSPKTLSPTLVTGRDVNFVAAATQINKKTRTTEHTGAPQPENYLGMILSPNNCQFKPGNKPQKIKKKKFMSPVRYPGMSLTKITENEYQSQDDPNERSFHVPVLSRDEGQSSPGMASTQPTGTYKGISKTHSPLLHYASRETNETMKYTGKQPSSESFGGIVCLGNTVVNHGFGFATSVGAHGLYQPGSDRSGSGLTYIQNHNAPANGGLAAGTSAQMLQAFNTHRGPTSYQLVPTSKANYNTNKLNKKNFNQTEAFGAAGANDIRIAEDSEEHHGSKSFLQKLQGATEKASRQALHGPQQEAAKNRQFEVQGSIKKLSTNTKGQQVKRLVAKSVPRRQGSEYFRATAGHSNLYLNEENASSPRGEAQHDMGTQKYYAGGHTTDQQDTPSSSKDNLSSKKYDTIKFPQKYPTSIGQKDKKVRVARFKVDNQERRNADKYYDANVDSNNQSQRFTEYPSGFQLVVQQDANGHQVDNDSKAATPINIDQIIKDKQSLRHKSSVETITGSDDKHRDSEESAEQIRPHDFESFKENIYIETNQNFNNNDSYHRPGGDKKHNIFLSKLALSRPSETELPGQGNMFAAMASVNQLKKEQEAKAEQNSSTLRNKLDEPYSKSDLRAERSFMHITHNRPSCVPNLFHNLRESPTLALSEIDNTIITIHKRSPLDRACFIERKPFGAALNPDARPSRRRSNLYGTSCFYDYEMENKQAYCTVTSNFERSRDRLRRCIYTKFDTQMEISNQALKFVQRTLPKYRQSNGARLPFEKKVKAQPKFVHQKSRSVCRNAEPALPPLLQIGLGIK